MTTPKLEEAVAALARAMVVMDAAVAGLNEAVTKLAAVEPQKPVQEGAPIQPARAGAVGQEIALRVVRKDGNGDV